MLEASRAHGPLRGCLTPPGDKSISHRALIMSALAQGRSTIRGLLHSADVMATRSALGQLGAIFSEEEDRLLIDGTGVQGLQAPSGPLDVGNSGTAMRLLAGVLSAQAFASELSGDDSLNNRPMRRILKPLREMGADIHASGTDTAPLKINGGHLHGIDYASPVASAQVKSCVLLAGLFAEGQTRVTEPEPSRDHTERMLPLFGVDMPAPCTVAGGRGVFAADISVPADLSSAAFLMAGALLVPGSDVVLKNVGLNPTRDGFLRALKAMGADLEITRDPPCGNEPAGSIRIRYSGRLTGIDLPAQWIPSMVDEIPILMVLAAVADGETRIRGASELRVKESDRLAVMGRGLVRLGIPVLDYEDGVNITGVAAFRDAVLESESDHRCAMSFAALALCAPGGLQIRNSEYIGTSYPGFVHDMTALGAKMKMT